MPNLQCSFEIETCAKVYLLWKILMQRGKSICCYSKFFYGGILENPTYDRVIFYYASAKEVETLYIKEIYHHKNELSTPLVPSKSKEDETNET